MIKCIGEIGKTLKKISTAERPDDKYSIAGTCPNIRTSDRLG